MSSIDDIIASSAIEFVFAGLQSHVFACSIRGGWANRFSRADFVIAPNHVVTIATEDLVIAPSSVELVSIFVSVHDVVAFLSVHDVSTSIASHEVITSHQYV